MLGGPALDGIREGLSEVTFEQTCARVQGGDAWGVVG